MIAELASLPGLIVLIPLLAAAGLALACPPGASGWVSVAAAGGVFVLACALPGSLQAGSVLLLDPLSAHLALLTGVVGLAAAWAGRAETVRPGHALAQLSLGATLLAMLANDLSVLWVGMEAAAVAAVLATGLPRTPDAAAAAWRILLPCGVGLMLALLGTVLVRTEAGSGWITLAQGAPQGDARLLNLGFVLMVLGYATTATAAALSPVQPVLALPLLNATLLVLIRLRGVLAASPAALDPGPPIVAVGLAGLLAATVALWRCQDIRRLPAVWSVGHSGLAAFAVGLGGRTAVFAGLLHATVHTLARTASGAARPGTLTRTACMIALAGLPPFGLFTSEALILLQTVRSLPLLAVPLGLGLAAGGWAVASRLLAPGAGPVGNATLTDEAPVWLLLGGTVVLGLLMPAAVAAWLDRAASVAP